MASSRFKLTRAMVSSFKPSRRPDLEVSRRACERFARIPPLRDVRYEAVDAGGCPAEWVVPARDEGRVVLYLHGGGYSVGSTASHRSFVGRLCRGARARGLSLDYRRAPEHPYPAALDDGNGAYHWLLQQGVAPGSIAVAGDSAGGGLALGLLMALRDGGGPLPACACCLSPWVDLAGEGESLWANEAVDPLLWPDHIAFFSRNYLGHRDPKSLPYASPLYGDPSGLPPLYIIVGTAEILLDDARRMAAAAEAAGVDTTLDVWDDMFHIFPVFAPLFPEATEGGKRLARFIKDHIAG